jgi:transposase InsO family protein
VSDGLIYYNARLVIPEAMRHHALQSLHDGHLGIVKCRSKAREAIWWPKIGKDIEQFVAACKTCRHFAPDSPEPLIPSTLPERPWQVLATDLFLHNDKHYIVTVDYYSRYFELQQLKSQTAEHVVSALKAAFARHGIPEVCVSDNGPCYASAEFQNFAAQYGFQHRTSSPRFAQSNGEAERAVRTAKEMLTKAKDIHLALLSYRSTPLENGYSPAQLLMGRQLRSTVPMTSALLKPSTPDEHALRNADEHSKARQKANYDRRHRAHPQPTRLQGEEVYIPDLDTEAIITKILANRDYLLMTSSGRVVRRNGRLLRSCLPQDAASDSPSIGTHCHVRDDAAAQPIARQLPAGHDHQPAPEQRHHPPAPGPYVTRSGREVRPPQRLNL